MKIVALYGAEWCGDCKRSRSLLDKYEVNYNYIDIDKVAGAADKVAEINNGSKSIPTIVFENGSILVEPSNMELQNKLNLGLS